MRWRLAYLFGVFFNNLTKISYQKKDVNANAKFDEKPNLVYIISCVTGSETKLFWEEHMKYVWLSLIAFACFAGGIVFKGWKLEKTYGVTPAYRATQFFRSPIAPEELATWQQIVAGDGDMPFAVSQEFAGQKKCFGFFVDKDKITGEVRIWAPPVGSPKRVISLDKGGQ